MARNDVNLYLKSGHQPAGRCLIYFYNFKGQGQREAWREASGGWEAGAGNLPRDYVRGQRSWSSLDPSRAILLNTEGAKLESEEQTESIISTKANSPQKKQQKSEETRQSM